MDNLTNLVEANLEQAHRGMLWWNAFIADAKPSDGDCVLFFPETDDEINIVALRNLQEYAGFAKAKKIHLFYSDPGLENHIPRHFGGECRAACLHDVDMGALMRIFAIDPISNRIIIVSLDQPEGRAGRNAIERNLASLEDAVKYGIYRLARV
jgi:hypothetical protein